MQRTDWVRLPIAVRDVVQENVGRVSGAETAAEGLNSAVALFLDTERGTVFLKGLPADHPGVVAQRREAVVNPYVRPVSPRLLWQAQIGGWDLLAFERALGRHADYAPGSADLPAVVDVVNRLGRLSCPRLPEFKRAADRWCSYLDDGADVELLTGETLLHTDYNPFNVLVHDGRAALLDWAWPTLGAAFIDPACLVLRLLAAGHSPAGAEAVVAACPAWTAAPRRAVDVFVTASARLWAEIAGADPVGFKTAMARGAARWQQHRVSELAAT